LANSVCPIWWGKISLSIPRRCLGNSWKNDKPRKKDRNVLLFVHSSHKLWDNWKRPMGGNVPHNRSSHRKPDLVPAVSRQLITRIDNYPLSKWTILVPIKRWFQKPSYQRGQKGA
jgi:hypothetical protein